VVLKVKSDHINEKCSTVPGTTQMSSYSRYEAFYEKCDCPGNPSKVKDNKRCRVLLERRVRHGAQRG
jgi:hypothetical protein